MKIEKGEIVSILINIVIYIILISILSINENTKDAIFVVGFTTIMISSLLSLFKVNLKKFKYFIWSNLILFILAYLYDAYFHYSGNLINHIIIFIIIILIFGIKYFKNKPKTTK
jgi:hypothetical protein